MGYELAEQMGWKLPDAILYPTGGGTGLIGMWKAFEELEQMGFVRSGRRPRMYAVQAEGCAPIVKAFEEGKDEAPMWEGATTHAHGIRVPKAIGDFLMLKALRASHGAGVAVSDAEIVQGVKDASAHEGLFMCSRGRGLRGRAAQAQGLRPPEPRRHGRRLQYRHRLQVRREHGAALVTRFH